MLILVVLPLYLFFNSAPSLRCGGQTELHAVLKVWSLKVLFPNYTAGLVLSTWWCAAFHWFFFFFCLLLLTEMEISELSAVIQELLLSYSCQFWAQQPLNTSSDRLLFPKSEAALSPFFPLTQFYNVLWSSSLSRLHFTVPKRWPSLATLKTISVDSSD